jgi:hypothetical protein
MGREVLDFLSAYYPRYLCPPCLATLMTEREPEVRAALRGITGVEFANADCTGCNRFTPGVRFRQR